MVSKSESRWALGAGSASPHLNARSSETESGASRAGPSFFRRWLRPKRQPVLGVGSSSNSSSNDVLRRSARTRSVAGGVGAGSTCECGEAAVPASLGAADEADGAAGRGGLEEPLRGRFFPAKLAQALGMAKCLLGLLLAAFGALALWEHAAMSNLGSGLWSGAVVLLSGVMGVMAGKKRSMVIYIVSFLVTSILALAAVGLLLIFAATGLARDSDAPWGYFVDQEDGNPVEFLGTIPLRQRPVIVNAVLVALGTLEAILSLASIFICVREACQCYTPLRVDHTLPRFSASSAGWRKATGSAPNLNLLTADQSPEGQARAYRLLRWLGQHRPQHPHYAQHLQHPHRPLHPHHGPQPVPVHRPGPRLYAAPMPMMAPVSHPMPYPSFVSGAPTAYVIPSMMPPMVATYAPFYSLGHVQPSMQPHELLEHGAGGGGTTKRKSKRDKRQRRKSGGGAAGGAGVASAAATKSVATGTTDADARPDSRCHHDDESADDELDRRQSIDIDDQVDLDAQSYVFTGMDRDIAEEFILHSLVTHRKMTSDA